MTSRNKHIRSAINFGALLFVAVFFGSLARGADSARPDMIGRSSAKVCAIYRSGMKCGTGFFNRRNSIVTDCHVISPMNVVAGIKETGEPILEKEDAVSIMVLTYGATTFTDAVLVSSEPSHDFAIIHSKTPGQPVILWNTFKPGDRVRVIGNPSGRDFQTTDTVITGIYPIRLPDGTMVNMIQVDSRGRIRPGYSGGGVFTDGENLIGTIESCNEEAQTCLAIPTSEIKTQIERAK